MMVKNFRRIPLGLFPTAVHPLSRLSKVLGGPQLFIKRDDQTGLAIGGNKTRKLEFLLAEALAQGAKTIITTGAPQSNHARQTAAAAAQLGLHCILFLQGPAPTEVQGNLLLDQLLGAEIRWAAKETMELALEDLITELRNQGHSPYLIPYGGSNALGALGYVTAMEELMIQAQQMNLPIDRIVCASSSGGTQAGLFVGAKVTGYSGQILGISVNETQDQLRHKIIQLATGTATSLNINEQFLANDICVDDRYLGAGYAKVGELEREAIQLAARTEGLLLDPVYTGRAFGGLVDLIRRGEIKPKETILFWHTGGIPALFAFSNEL